MNHGRGIGHRAQRTGAYAESKMSNWGTFNPASSEIDSVLRRFARDLDRSVSLIVRSVPVLTPMFVMPVTELDVQETLAKVPEGFLVGLRAVFLLGGSRKQAESVSRKIFAFGRYKPGYIFLHPFPAVEMMKSFKVLPKPSVRRDYERAGGVWKRTDSDWALVLTAESLRTFYLRDVLFHELGHHVDRFSRKDRRSSEAFAEWVATEYGFRIPALTS